MLAYPCVSYVLPFCIHIPDGMYDAIIEKQRYRIHTLFITNKETAHSPMLSRGHWEIHHDAFGRTGNTELTIIFCSRIEKPELGALTKPISEVTPEDLQTLDRWGAIEENYVLSAVDAGNRLLEIYRDKDVNNKGEPSFHIFPVTGQDVSNVRFYLLDTDNNMIFTGGLRPYFKSSQSLGTRPPEVVRKITDSLLADSPAPIWRTLILNAQNWLWRADYRLVPVEANSAFEVIAEKTLSKFVCLRSYQKDTSRLTLLDKLILIQQLSNDHRGDTGKITLSWAPSDNNVGWRDFLSVQDHLQIAEWYQQCYMLRNKVIHEGFVNVEKAEAEAAIVVTEKAIGFLMDLDN